MGDLYIRPVALVYGRDAEAAVEQGAGLSLAGHTGIAWTAASVS
jgi:hypothetical protein